MDLTLPPTATEGAFQKLKEVGGDMPLRVSVEGGGCSGFKYNIDFDNNINDEDFIISKDNLKILIDPVSLQFLNGSVIDYKIMMQRDRWKVTLNLNNIFDSKYYETNLVQMPGRNITVGLNIEI